MCLRFHFPGSFELHLYEIITPKKGAHDSDSGIINFDMIHDSKRTHFDMYLDLGEAHFDIDNSLKLSLFDTLMIRNSPL